MQPLVVPPQTGIGSNRGSLQSIHPDFRPALPFWIVADGDERVLVPLNSKNDSFFHAASLAHERILTGEAGAGGKDLRNGQPEQLG